MAHNQTVSASGLIYLVALKIKHRQEIERQMVIVSCISLSFSSERNSMGHRTKAELTELGNGAGTVMEPVTGYIFGDLTMCLGEVGNIVRIIICLEILTGGEKCHI